MYSIHPGGNGDGFSLVPPEWCSVPSTPRTRTKSGSLTRGQVVRFAAVVGPVQGALQVAEEHDAVIVRSPVTHGVTHRVPLRIEHRLFRGDDHLKPHPNHGNATRSRDKSDLRRTAFRSVQNGQRRKTRPL